MRLARSLLRHLEEIVAGSALIIVVLAVCWGVVTRYITAQPATWAGEVAAIAFAWVVFIGAAAGAKRRMHVSIDMLVTLLPAPLRRSSAILVDFAVVLFCSYVAYLGLLFTGENWDNPTSVLRWPLSIVYVAVAIGFGLMAIRFTQGALARRRHPEPAS